MAGINQAVQGQQNVDMDIGDAVDGDLVWMARIGAVLQDPPPLRRQHAILPWGVVPAVVPDDGDQMDCS